MSITASEMTPADIAAVTNNNCKQDGGWGLGGDGLVGLIVLFLFASMFGYGGFGGFGFGGMGGFGAMGNRGGFGGGWGPCATQYDVRAAVDQQTLISKLDGITNGLCDSTYALTGAITNGFASAELSRCNQQAALMAQLNQMMMANQQCCCETGRAIERGFADTNYNIATQSCDTRNTIQNTTRDIIDNQNANARAILDALTAQRIADKDERIAEQNQKIFALELAASQTNQNAYITANQQAQTAELIRRLGADCPVNAVVVQPNTPVTFPVNCCNQAQFANNGCNNGCF